MQIQAAAPLPVLPYPGVDGLGGDSMLSVPRRRPFHPAFDLFGTVTLPEKLQNEQEYSRIIEPVLLSALSLIRSFLCGVGRIAIATTSQLAAHSGLVASENSCNLCLGQPCAIEGFQLFSFGTGKMGHTVGRERVKSLPSYRINGGYAFEISVRVLNNCCKLAFMV